MLNGRHLILLGGLAAAGLLSVREGERQVGLCYRIASVEKEIRGVKSGIKLCKIEHLALQSPKAVTDKAAALGLAVAPIPAGAQTSQIVQPPPARNANGRPNRTTPPPAPHVPGLPNATLSMDRTACR